MGVVQEAEDTHLYGFASPQLPTRWGCRWSPGSPSLSDAKLRRARFSSTGSWSPQMPSPPYRRPPPRRAASGSETSLEGDTVHLRCRHGLWHPAKHSRQSSLIRSSPPKRLGVARGKV